MMNMAEIRLTWR